MTFPQTQDSPPVLPLLEMGGTTFPENLLATCVPFSGQSPCPDPPPARDLLASAPWSVLCPFPHSALGPPSSWIPKGGLSWGHSPPGAAREASQTKLWVHSVQNSSKASQGLQDKLQTLQPAFQVPLPESVCPVLSLTSLSPWKPSAPAQPLAAT